LTSSRRSTGCHGSRAGGRSVPGVHGAGTGLENVVRGLASDGQLVHVRTLPGRTARVAGLARPLRGRVAGLVPPEGLWAHQAAAIDLVRDGSSVALATGTASGKSLCYQIPIAEAIVGEGRPWPETALLLYPTKALAQDQLRSFGALDVPGMVAVTYDGDSTFEQRA